MRDQLDRPGFWWWTAWLLLLAFAFGSGRYLWPVRPPTPKIVLVKPSPTPTPRPTPTPAISVPGKLFLGRSVKAKLNGLELHTELQTEPGETATVENAADSSYQLHVAVRVKVPKANASVRELSAINPHLPELLPGLEALTKTAHVSAFFEELYQRKLRTLRAELLQLDRPLSRHDFFDCETILELEHPQTKRRALLIQSDMDVDTDGSDSDRVSGVDSSDVDFQPTTSYRWPKTTATPNPFLATREAQLQQLQKSFRGTAPSETRSRMETLRHEIDDLKKHSFLVAATDPYIVLPGLMVGKGDSPFTPRIGDYCAVVYQNVIYPAILGDAGPNYKLGEASWRIGKKLNVAASATNSAVSALKVTYLVFPNTAEKTPAAPDLEKWRTHCELLLNELGGYTGELHAWENLIKPKPTPSPSPSPKPSPAASPVAKPPQTPNADAKPISSPVPPQASPSPAPSPPAKPSPSKPAGRHRPGAKPAGT